MRANDSIEAIARAMQAEHTAAVTPAYTACDLGDGRAMLYDRTGYAWGVYANPTVCASLAEKLSAKLS